MISLFFNFFFRFAKFKINNGYINPIIIIKYLYMVLLKKVKLEMLRGRIQIILIKKIDIYEKFCVF